MLCMSEWLNENHLKNNYICRHSFMQSFTHALGNRL